MVSWQEVNTFLNMAIILGSAYMWYKQPFLHLKNIVQELKDAQSKSKLIMDSLMESIIVSDKEGNILEYNKASEDIFGYTADEIKYTNVLRLIPDKYKEQHIAGLQRVNNGGESRLIGSMIDAEGLHKNGSLVPIALSLTKISAPTNTYYVAVIRNISHRRRNEEQVRMLNSALTTRLLAAEAFNRSICHDLNAPMRTIDGFTEILEQDYMSQLDNNGKNYISRIRNAVRKVRQLIKDMMKLALVTQPDTRLDLRNISLTNLFRAIVSEYSMAYPEYKVKVTVMNDMNVYADPDLIAIVIENLVSNAWKFTSKNKNPSIEIGCNIINGESVYHIKDNGVGFDQSKVDKLFKPFSRLHSQDLFEGSGIGLSIIKRIIDLHKGKVWAEGVVDRGAIFYFTLGTKNE